MFFSIKCVIVMLNVSEFFNCTELMKYIFVYYKTCLDNECLHSLIFSTRTSG